MIERLTTDRGQTARRWSRQDVGAVIEAFDDPSMDTQRDEPLSTPAEAERWILAHCERWVAGTAYSWAVELDGLVCAAVNVSSIDRQHGIGWISYWTTRSARGCGVAASALRAVSTWAFAELELFRLELGHRVNNPASCRVALAAGYITEGIERQKLRYGDERFDVELHARLASDAPPHER